MTAFDATFIIPAGIFLALMGLVAAWLFRTASAPIIVKLSVPTLIVIIACVTPRTVAALMGYPVWSEFSALPQKAELVAFVPNDTAHTAALWLRVGSDAPRAYEITLTDEMKKTLREAGERIAHGERVGVKKGGHIHPGVTDIETPEAPYVLSDDVFSLPKKGED